MLAVHKHTDIPIAEGLDSLMDLPYTISYAVLYREKINSFNELPKDKQPPRNLWDKPYQLSEFLDKVWDTKKEDKGTEFYNYELEEVE